METLTNPWLSLAGPLAGVVGAFLLWRSSRRGQDKTGEGGFRSDLLKRIDQLESAQIKDEATIEAQQVRIDELREVNHQLRESNRALQSQVADQRVQIADLIRRLEAVEVRPPDRRGAGAQ